MLNAFTWMLKIKEFKKHFIYLTITTVLLYSIIYFIPKFNLPAIINLALTIICLAIPVLAIWGYSWDAAQNVVDRRVTHEYSTIYHKSNQKEIIDIELPEFNLFKHIWRGISAIVAIALLILPLYLLLGTTGILNLIYTNVSGISAVTVACLYYFAFFPALLWNYAKNNSVVSVYNIPKAVYVMGNYTKKYVLQTLFMVVVGIADTLINQAIVIGPLYIFNKEIFTNINIQTFYSAIFNTETSLILFLIPLTVLMIKNIYVFLVYAYLLGTIAPIDEF